MQHSANLKNKTISVKHYWVVVSLETPVRIQVLANVQFLIADFFNFVPEWFGEYYASYSNCNISWLIPANISVGAGSAIQF